MAAADNEKMTDEEVDELLKGVQIGPYVSVSIYRSLFVEMLTKWMMDD